MIPMEAAAAERIRKRLVELGTEVDVNGSVTLQLPDAGHTEIDALELFRQDDCTSFALNVYSNSSSMVDLIYEISNTTEFTIQAAMDDSRAIVTRPELLSSGREIFGGPVCQQPRTSSRHCWLRVSRTLSHTGTNKVCCRCFSSPSGRLFCLGP